MSRPHLYFFLLALSIGVATGELWAVPMMALAAAAASAIALIATPPLRLLSVLLFGLTLGIFRVQGVAQVHEYDVVQLVGQTRTVTGQVVLPSSTDGSAQRFELVEVTDKQRYVGKLLVAAPAFPRVTAGSRVRTVCMISPLTERSRWRQWSHGIHAACATPAVTMLGRATGWRSMLGRWQERIVTYVRQQFNEPQASLLNGILIGNTTGMPDHVVADFQATGTTHVVALSGFNVTIIMTLVVSWFVHVIGRRWAWLPALLLLVVFVVMSGASASVVRAAVMAIVVQLGLFFGRPVAIGRLLAYTAIVMVVMNPLMLYHDLGFQLSFLATVGLVAAARPLADRLRFVPERLSFRDNLSTTLAAILTTEPLLLWRFGRLSLIAPLVNLFVLPLIPVTMAVGAVSMMGMLVPALGRLVIPVTDALLRLVLWGITTAASWPNSQVILNPVVSMIVAFGCVVLVVPLFYHHEEESLPPA